MITPEFHELIEAEGHDLYLYGIEVGIRLANEAMTRAIDDALGGPNGYGLEDAPVTAKDAVRRMLRGMVGVS